MKSWTSPRASPPDLVLPSDRLRRFVQEVAGGNPRRGSLKSATLELENAPPSVAVPLNPKRLRRVFFNLSITRPMPCRAAERSCCGFVRLHTEVITEIEDTGPGIAPEIAGQLFDAFATLRQSPWHGAGAFHLQKNC